MAKMTARLLQGGTGMELDRVEAEAQCDINAKLWKIMAEYWPVLNDGDTIKITIE